MLAGHGDVAKLQIIGIGASYHVESHLPAVIREDAVPPHIVGQVVLQLAGNRAASAADAATVIDRNAVFVSHEYSRPFFTSPSYLRTSTSVSSNDVFIWSTFKWSQVSSW